MKKLFVAATVLASTALAACGGDPCQNTNYTVLSKIQQPPGSSGTKFIVTADTTHEKLVQLASSACGSRWCKLLIWDDVGVAGTSFPLSAAEASSQVASYIHNPAKNYERLLVRGETVPMGKCANVRP